MKYALIAGALLGAMTFTPAFADTAGPSDAEMRAALRVQPMQPVSDSELRNYAAAEEELATVYPSPPLSPGQMERVRAQTADILARNHFTATRYNEIAMALDINSNLAERFAAISSHVTGG